MGAKQQNGVSKSERHFLDFVIDGESLWEKLGKPLDTVSVICLEFSREETIDAVRRLLLAKSAVIPNDRRELFICSECGDIGCGAVTVSIVRDGQAIIWKSFGYENNYEPDLRLDNYKQIGPYTFDYKEYESVLLRAIADLKTHPSTIAPG